MKTYDVKQGSPEWLQLRLGVVTASELDALLTPLWRIRTGDGPTTYLYQKVCEKALGFTMDSGSSWQMSQGSILEGEALPWFEFDQDVKVDRMGFCTTDDGRVGCSPDGLIGEDGGIELKCPQPPTHLKYLLEGEVPAQYLAQVHCSMYVTGRKWWKFVSYSRQFPALVVHVERDEAVQHQIKEALAVFLSRFDNALKQIKAMKAAHNEAKQAAYVADETK
jgi:hypothetical protein